MQDRIVAVDTRPTISGADETFIKVSIFDVRSAAQRYNVKIFRGDVAEITRHEYEVYSLDSGNRSAMRRTTEF